MASEDESSKIIKFPEELTPSGEKIFTIIDEYSGYITEKEKETLVGMFDFVVQDILRNSIELVEDVDMFIEFKKTNPDEKILLRVKRKLKRKYKILQKDLLFFEEEFFDQSLKIRTISDKLKSSGVATLSNFFEVLIEDIKYKLRYIYENLIKDDKIIEVDFKQ